MKAAWALQDAKNQFCEMVELAMRNGPQWVTRRGEEAVVVVAAKDFRRMKRPAGTLADFFRLSPLRGVELKLERSKDRGRKVDL